MKAARRLLGDIEIGCEVRGEGPPLLLLHAFPFDRTMWNDVVPGLLRRFRVITMDFRGFGWSEAAERGFSIAQLGDDAAALLDDLGLARAAVCGLSMGGYAALAMARRHGARLQALILADTRAGADDAAALAGRNAAIDRVAAGGASAYLDELVPRLLDAAAPEALRSHVRSLANDRPAALLAALRALRDRPDRTAELADIRCPTLVLVGAGDRITPPAEAEAMARAIPGAAVQVLPGAGHLSSLEAPAAFTEAVTAFLARAS